jgi:beta-phosphoglucomutase-like phosphatase (HAD superfamily)
VSALIVDLDGTLVDAAVADHPRAWGRSAERAMAVRLVDAWHVLGSAGEASPVTHPDRGGRDPC